MSPFISLRFKSLLGAGMLAAGLLSLAQGPACAQTRTAELDRIQAPAQALPRPEQRVALVIGNSNYRNVAQLPNPDNDAQSMAQFLNSAGFEVISATDVTQNDMIQVVQDFSDKVAERGPNTVAMIYYAGHGVQVAGENYLIPVDAKVAPAVRPRQQFAAARRRDGDAGIDPEPAAHRVLDACRNNPFPTIDDGGRGLAMVDAPLRSIVGYSTAPGAEALDGRTAATAPIRSLPAYRARAELADRAAVQAHSSRGEPCDRGHADAVGQLVLDQQDFYFFGDTAVACDPPARARPGGADGREPAVASVRPGL